jgi:hypothetical protein
MRPTSRAACPNCGKELELPVSATKFVCKHCGEALRIAPDKRLFLLTPISRYSQLGGKVEDAKPAPSAVDQTPHHSEERRRQFSAEMGFTRIERQKQEAKRFFRVGVGLFVVGILFLLVVLARAALAGLVFSDAILPALLILCLISFGVYFIIWSVMVTRSSSEEEEELRQELEILKGKVANDS